MICWSERSKLFDLGFGKAHAFSDICYRKAAPFHVLNYLKKHSLLALLNPLLHPFLYSFFFTLQPGSFEGVAQVAVGF